jgi:UDP-N-acetylenolpyruvoylglucosamine reductase
MNKKQFKHFAITTLALLAFTVESKAQISFENWSGQAYDSSKSPLIYTPRTLEQVVAIVKKSAAEKKKIRVSGARHSWSSVVISDSSIYLSTTNLKKIGPIETKDGKSVITVEAGVMLGTLTDYLFEKGFSLGFAMPEYRGLTIAGLVATGSHGSSRKHAAVSNQIVNKIVLVTANGDVRELTKKDGDLFKAATVNLGAMGVVTSLELTLAPKSNIKLTSTVMDLEKSSLSEFLNAEPQEDFLFVMWFPRLKKAILESGVITQEPADKGAENVLFGLNAGVLESDYGAAAILAKGRADATGAVESMIEAKRFAGLSVTPRFVVDVDGFDVNKAVVVGPSNKMLLARGDTITWPYKLSDYSFAFPVSDLAKVMKTIETFSNEKNYSFPNAGISMRFVHSDGGESSLISHFEDADHKNGLFVSAEFLEFRDLNLKGDSTSPRDPLRNELLALLISKHHVKFHMGKNDDAILKSEPTYSNTANQYARFKNTVKLVDPEGMFINDFVTQLIETRTAQ